MEFKQIQDLLKFINKSDISDFEIEQGEFKMRISRKTQENVIMSSMPAQVVAAPQQVQQQPQQVTTPPAQNAPQSQPATTEAAPVSNDNLYEFKSPIIGTFYRSPSPDKEQFVKVGDSVSKGQVLCIIEAMKLFNEIESDVEGKIVKFLVENAQPVEYDQPLFLIERS